MIPPANGSHGPIPGEPGLVPGSVLIGHMNPQAALASWAELRPFLASALDWGDGRETEASLFAKILHGQNILFAVLRVPQVVLSPHPGAAAPRHVGLVAVELSFDGAYANIVAMALDPREPKETFPGAINFLRQLLAPVTWFECYSRRGGMERFLTGHGWRVGRRKDQPPEFKRFVLGPEEPEVVTDHAFTGRECLVHRPPCLECEACGWVSNGGPRWCPGPPAGGIDLRPGHEPIFKPGVVPPPACAHGRMAFEDCAECGRGNVVVRAFSEPAPEGGPPALRLAGGVDENKEGW